MKHPAPPAWRPLLLAAAFGGSVLLSSPALAYTDFSSQAALYNSMSINAGYGILADNTLSAYYGDSRKSGKKKSNKKSSKKKQAAKHHANYYRFKPDSRVTGEVTDEFIAYFQNTLRQQGNLNPQTQSVLDQLKQADIIGQVRQGLQSEGYDPNSVATAMGAWIVTNYGIATGQGYADLEGHALIEQLEAAMGGEDSDLIGKSDREKQTVAEALYWMTMTMMMVQQEAENTGNQALLAETRQQARSALAEWGLSTTMLTSKAGRVKLAPE